MQASPEDCFLLEVLIYSDYLWVEHLATTRRTLDDWGDIAASVPMELVLSGQLHTPMYLPDLPAAVTP
jgi:hypothetical protein